MKISFFTLSYLSSFLTYLLTTFSKYVGQSWPWLRPIAQRSKDGGRKRVEEGWAEQSQKCFLRRIAPLSWRPYTLLLTLRSDVLLNRKKLNSRLQNTVAPFFIVRFDRVVFEVSTESTLKIMFWRRHHFQKGHLILGYWPNKIVYVYRLDDVKKKRFSTENAFRNG